MALIPLTAWSLTSPNGSAWVWTISTAGIITITSQVTVVTATPPVFQGVGTTIWTPSIDNAGIVTLTDGVAGTQFLAVLADPDIRRWYPFVDAGGVVTWMQRGWAAQLRPAGA